MLPRYAPLNCTVAIPALIYVSLLNAERNYHRFERLGVHASTREMLQARQRRNIVAERRK